MKKIYTLLLLFACFTLVSCSSSKYNNFTKVSFDRTLEFTTHNELGVTINSKTYPYETLAYNIIKKKCTYYAYAQTEVLDYTYYLYQYNYYGEATEESNNYTFDVGLFRTNNITADTELLYDFKGLMPTYMFTYTNQNCFEVVDSDTLFFQYNGKIQLFDIPSKKVIHSYDVYDAKEARNTTYFKYRRNAYGDYYGIENKVLKFYENKNRDFIYHSYNVGDDAIYIERVEDYIVTSNYTDRTEYYDCIEISTGISHPEKLEDCIKALKETEDIKEEVVESDEITVSGVKLKVEVTSDVNQYEIDLKKDDEIKYHIDEEYIKKNCSSAMKALACYGQNAIFYFKGYKVDGNRLFLFCDVKYPQMISYSSSPTVIIEFDFSDNKLYYSGYYNLGYMKNFKLS